ncbi:MAG: PilN domain-containing protein [Actinomycetota bacterium]
MSVAAALLPGLCRFLLWWAGELAALSPIRPRRPGHRAQRLPRDAVLCRRLSLPAAAEADLARVLAFELDRETPFAAADAAFAWSVAGRDAAAKRIEVDLVVAPRARIDALLAGDPGATVEAEGPGGAVFDLTPRQHRGKGWRRRGLAVGLVVVLAVAGGAAEMARRARLLSEVEAAAAQARGRAEAAARLRQELDRLDGDTRLVRDRKEARPPMVVVLERVTAALPDDAWLTQLDVAEGEVRLWGTAPSATTVARRLESEFGRAEFRAPVSQEGGGERFQLAARLESGR